MDNADAEVGALGGVSRWLDKSWDFVYEGVLGVRLVGAAGYVPS